MGEVCANSCVEQQAAQIIVKSLIIQLLEAGLLDAEEMRRLLDDAVAGAASGDDGLRKALGARVTEIVQASYAAEPEQQPPYGQTAGPRPFASGTEGDRPD